MSSESAPLSALPFALTVDEAADLLRVDRKTLYSAISEGSVPGVLRLGRTIRIARDALLKWASASGRPDGESQ